MKNSSPPSLELEQRESVASLWTRRGIVLLEEGHYEAAIPWFDAAIQIRGHFPLDQNSWYRYGLAAGWINRGDSLVRLGEPQQIEEAIRSFDEAILQMQRIPFEDNPLWRKRLVIAWTHRGLALAQQGTDLNESIRSLNEAQKHLHPDVENYTSMLLSIESNKAIIQFKIDGDTQQAKKKALEILEHVKPDEREHPELAQIGLTSRHLLALSIGHQIDNTRTTKEHSSNQISFITDLIEDGIQLIDFWSQNSIHRFFRERQTLFFFGLQFYKSHLPHFVSEYIQEHLMNSKSGFRPTLNQLQLTLQILSSLENNLRDRISKKILLNIDPETTSTLLKTLLEITHIRIETQKQILIS